MSSRRRRKRRHDPLASTHAVRGVLDRVAARLPASAPSSHRDVVKILRAASHCERTGWRSFQRGRRPQFDRSTLRAAWTALDEELARYPDSAVSPRTFAEHYVRLLGCPQDILGALSDGRINLFEALQLARIKAASTGLTSAGATRLRARVLASHLAGQASARQLYERVSALLAGEQGTVEVRSPARGDYDGADIDDEVDSYVADPGALFSDQLRQVAMALAQIDPDTLTEGDTGTILDLLDQLYLRASKAARRSR